MSIPVNPRLDYYRQYNKVHNNRIVELNKQYRHNNKEEFNAKRRLHYAKNKDRVKQKYNEQSAIMYVQKLFV